MIGAPFTLGARFTAPPPVAWSLPAPPPDVRPPIVAAGNTNELCQLVTNYAPKFIPLRAIAERKHDGIRALWIGGATITRGGRTIWCAAHLWPALERLEAAFGEPMFFDGEYVEPGGFGATARRVSKAIHEREPVTGTGSIWLWDAVPADDWRSGRGSAALVERKTRLKAALASMGDPGLRFVDHVTVSGEAHLRRLEADAYARGDEGLVLKDLRGAHHPGRSRLWQRLKRKLSLDLPVIGYSEATAGDVLGSIIVDHEGVGVRVHAGFNDSERATLWRNPAALVGRIAEIEAMEKTDFNSLRQPRFLRWRDDLEGARP